MAWVGKDLKDHLSSSPLALYQFAQSPIQPELHHFQWGDIHSLSGQPITVSQTWSPTVGSSSFSEFLPLPSMTWVVGLQNWLVKTKAKKSLSTSAFSMSRITTSSVSFWRGPTFSLVFCLSPMNPLKSFCCCLWWPPPDLILLGL